MALLGLCLSIRWHTLVAILFILLYLSTPILAYDTLIDVLSGDPRFETLIRHLQHTRLVPTLNRLQAGTLFAPDNHAFEEFEGYITRELLLYHLLPAGVKISSMDHGQLLESSYVRPGMLGSADQGQRIKVARAQNGRTVHVNQASIVTEDIFVNKKTYMHAVDQVLVPPPTLVEKFLQDSAFYALLDLSGVASVLKQERPFTIFRSDHGSVLDCFNPVERAYMTGEYGAADLMSFVRNMVIEKPVYAADLALGNTSYVTLGGESLNVRVDSTKAISVNGISVTKTDILAANGVIHLLERSFLPPSLVFDQRKYLYGLNATKFVALLDNYDMGHYLSRDATRKYTFLVPGNDDINQNAIQQRNRKEWLSYHVLPGCMTPERLADQTLLKTEFISRQLGNVPQRVPVHVATTDARRKSIRFGNSHVVGDPVSVGGHMIYRVSDPLSLPSDILSNIAIDLDVSAFIAGLYVSETSAEIMDTTGITLFTPSNEAFESLGLVARYLMHPTGKLALQNVLRYHAVQGLLYRDEMRQHQHEMPTLAGGDVKLNIGPGAHDGQIIISPSSSSSLPPTTQPATVVSDTDLLASNGVVHKIDSVLFPEDVQIHSRDLLVGAQTEIMLKVLDTVGLLESLNQSDHIILVPSDRAFDQLNMDELFGDQYALERLARLHVIPAGWQEQWHRKEKMTDEPHPLHYDEYPTILSEKDTLLFRQDKHGNWLIHVKGQVEADPARVQAAGRTCGRGVNSGGVLLIDTVLMPVRRGFLGLPWAWSIALVLLLCILGAATLCAAGFYGYKYYKRVRLGYQSI